MKLDDIHKKITEKYPICKRCDGFGVDNQEKDCVPCKGTGIHGGRKIKKRREI